MTPEERADLLRKLDELARQLHGNTGDRKQALADLSKLEDALRSKIDPKAGQKQAMLQAMAAQLQALAKNGEANQPADLKSAAEALNSSPNKCRI